MAKTDIYTTIEKPGESLFKDRSSKFFGYAFHISSKEEVKPIIEQLKKEHHASRHVCFAYSIGAHHAVTRANDDGEPSNSAGTPILNQIKSFELTNTLVAVVRYFGGIKLGVSGLINAYREGAKEAIEDAKLVEKMFTKKLTLTTSFDHLNGLMRMIKDKEWKITDQRYDTLVHIDVLIPFSEFEQVCLDLEDERFIEAQPV